MQKGVVMYAQLNTKTVFSFMDATVKLTDYITAAKTLGYQTLGISDVDNLHAAHQFITQAKAAGIQPVGILSGQGNAGACIQTREDKNGD